MVVITGPARDRSCDRASAGPARAAVGLLARGETGLQAAAAEIEDAGGVPLAIPTDVSDYGAVDQAARRVEERFGPIDAWINVAFTSVFAPFAEIDPDEFRRVTEVTYLGYVYGTMAALKRMRPRDCGVIVQVGSALGARAIPLQSAYCGAKHAVNGFTESLRTELMHEGSSIRVTVVQMPAVNTPQFSWVLSRLSKHPQPVPPIYQPEVAARGVIHALDHPRRKQYWVGPAPSPPSRVSGSCRRCSTATSPAPATAPSRPSSRSVRAGPRTCGSRSTARAVATSGRTACSTIAHTRTARNSGRPGIVGRWRAPR
ncbi:short chain dehydrogenase family protein [Mycobacterium xenopi 3993]|nr:short chain dehydrogenase family protein [Mycobacterium xenopi 3993]